MKKSGKLCKDFIRVHIPDIKIRQKNIRRAVKTIYAAGYGITHLSTLSKIWNNKCLALPQLDFVITTICILRCRECSNLMKYFHNPENYETDYLENTLDKLLEYIDEIHELRVLGGEPFVHPNLDKILSNILQHPQIKKIVIFTNGTILPAKSSLIQILKNKRVSITISDYGDYSKEKINIIKLCKKNNIKCSVNFIPLWLSFGNLETRKRSKKELIRQFQRCNNICKSYLEGKIYWCERQASGNKLGFVNGNDYVDIMNSHLSRSEMQELIRQYCSNTTYITACLQCDKGTDSCKEVPIAEQLPKGGSL